MRGEIKRFAAIGPPWLEAQPTVGENGRVGVNAAPLLAWRDGALQPARDGVRLGRLLRGLCRPLRATYWPIYIYVPTYAYSACGGCGWGFERLADPTVQSHVAGKTIRKIVVAKGPLVSIVV